MLILKQVQVLLGFNPNKKFVLDKKKCLDKKQNSCYNIIAETKESQNATKEKRKNHESIYQK